MPHPTMPFKQGDRVLVITGTYKDQLGIVHMVLSTMTIYGLYEIVWVKLAPGKIEGFKPENLVKFDP